MQHLTLLLIVAAVLYLASISSCKCGGSKLAGGDKTAITGFCTPEAAKCLQETYMEGKPWSKACQDKFGDDYEDGEWIDKKCSLTRNSFQDPTHTTALNVVLSDEYLLDADGSTTMGCGDDNGACCATKYVRGPNKYSCVKQS